MNVRNITTFTVLLFIAIGTWYLARSLQPTEIVETMADGAGDGFYLKSAQILGTDDEGQLLYEIEADFVEQQQSNDMITADEATINEDQSLLRLSGHVIAVSDAGSAEQITEIRTPQLDIEPTTYKAETDSRVQIRIGSRSLTATGMLALLQDNRLQLRSNVSGKFVP
jgi:lipopolysaccharide export system protein LptC